MEIEEYFGSTIQIERYSYLKREDSVRKWKTILLTESTLLRAPPMEASLHEDEDFSPNLDVQETKGAMEKVLRERFTPIENRIWSDRFQSVWFEKITSDPIPSFHPTISTYLIKMRSLGPDPLKRGWWLDDKNRFYQYLEPIDRYMAKHSKIYKYLFDESSQTLIFMICCEQKEWDALHLLLFGNTNLSLHLEVKKYEVTFVARTLLFYFLYEKKYGSVYSYKDFSYSYFSSKQTMHQADDSKFTRDFAETVEPYFEASQGSELEVPKDLEFDAYIESNLEEYYKAFLASNLDSFVLSYMLSRTKCPDEGVGEKKERTTKKKS
jgi:hypothetical protein